LPSAPSHRTCYYAPTPATSAAENQPNIPASDRRPPGSAPPAPTAQPAQPYAPPPEDPHPAASRPSPACDPRRAPPPSGGCTCAFHPARGSGTCSNCVVGSKDGRLCADPRICCGITGEAAASLTVSVAKVAVAG